MAPPSKISINRNPKDSLKKFHKQSKKSSKPGSKRPDNAVQSQALSLQLEDDVPDFPRGGGNSLNRQVVDKVRAEVDADKRELKKRKKNNRVKKKSHSKEDDFGSLFSGGITGKLSRFTNKITEKIAKLQSSESKVSEFNWVKGFNIGSVIEGKVYDSKDFGVVVSFEKYNDVFGFITHYQLAGNTVEIGSTVHAVVLDVAKIERIVDLSLNPVFVDTFIEKSSDIQTHKKKRKREAHRDLELHRSVNAIVEIVKENYLVLSLPEYNFAIGYAPITDFNTQTLPSKQFVNGQSVTATIMALPSPSTFGRLLLLLKSISEVTETSSSKREKKRSSYNVGSVVQAEITEIKPLEVRLKFGYGFHGRVHVTEANDDNVIEDPFSSFRIGQTLTARIISKSYKSENNRKNYKWELSIKPSMLTGSREMGVEPITEDFNYSIGQRVSGFVYKVDKEWVWLAVSRHVKAQLYLLDSGCEPTELQEFQKHFNVGNTISGYILSTNKEKKLLRLVLHPLSVSPDGTIGHETFTMDDLSYPSNENVTSHIHEGDILGGRISKILPGVGGLLVQIDPHLYGKVHFMELTDLWMSDPLSGYHEGQFVKCKVLEISRSVKGTVHVDMSLRSSLCGKDSQKSIELSHNKLSNNVHSPSQRVEKFEDLHPKVIVQGYVKNVTPKGCFVMLSRNIDAKILLSNLSDGYIENPEMEFPIGKLVIGKVVSVEPLSKRVEVSLKTSSAIHAPTSGINDLINIWVGDVISGRIKRVELYGLFITINHTNMVGLCHVSELSDDHVDNIETKYRAGEKVRAKILKVDVDRHRVSLGMKNSYFSDDAGINAASTQGSDDAIEENGLTMATQLPMLPDSVSAGIQNLGFESENREHLILAEVEERASILPLAVPLDDTENSDMENADSRNIENVDDVDTMDEKNKRWAKKKARKEREHEIKAAEKRVFEHCIPRSTDDYEKLVRCSPNNSFIWKNYMAFMLSLADVEKARSIAERALRTINFRAESQKLNIWISYFNLENEFGNPPEEAVVRVFQKALKYCDPKKLHLVLLGLYERTKQHKLSCELLEKMVKKFRRSCKVWLMRYRSVVEHNPDQVELVRNRAILSLPRYKHIKFILHSAIFEFKNGVPDRGRSMFEGMLREYPKKTNLWNIYLDQEIKLGDMDVIRALFEKAISLRLPPRKMKSLFKKYLKYEKSLCDKEGIRYVKRKAMEYVET